MQKRHDAEVKRDLEDYFRTVERSKKRFDSRVKRNSRSVERQLKKLCDEIDEAKKAEAQPQPAALIDTSNLGESFKNLSGEEALLYSMSLVFAAGGAALIKRSQDKKKSFEFESNDIEAPQKENKKEIKKTLKNIMQKNNAKTHLIQ